LTLVVLRTASGSVLHGPFLAPDRAAWVELAMRIGAIVDFQEVRG
jgi:hypothetical protein